MLRFIVLTVCRYGEAARMHPGEVQGDLWRVQAVRIKAGKEHVVPLVKEALEQLPFQPVSDVSLSKCIRRHTALPATTHGMRSTFRDWCGERPEQGGSDRAIASRLRRQSWSAESGISDVNRSLSTHGMVWREYPRVRHRREFAPLYGKRRRAVDAVRRRNRRRGDEPHIARSQVVRAGGPVSREGSRFAAPRG